ncbi:MAG: LCP family protein, partial [Eubacteriales bacterium]|nr:LCP family protein [Eubacteriales bacterium]
ARADSIALLVMNEMTNEMHVISINRDTMTQIRRYTMNGTDEGFYTTHLGYAFSYGDGGKVSCENLAEAVSKLFGNIPIREYVVTNQDSMPYINDLVGGITLTVPNSDLEDKNPEFIAGEEVQITADNINTYLRYRDIGESFSNEGRMERQKSYTIAYFDKLKNMNVRVWKNYGSLPGI